MGALVIRDLIIKYYYVIPWKYWSDNVFDITSYHMERLVKYQLVTLSLPDPGATGQTQYNCYGTRHTIL